MSGGVATALEAVLEGQGSGDTLAQTGLFDDDALDVGETGALDAASPLSAALTPAPGKKGVGRPKGAQNRRTEAVVAWLLSQHRHPLSVMMEAYSMSPAELAKRIGIAAPDDDQLLDIFKLQVRMAESCAPYVAQKQSQAIDLSGAAPGMIVNVGGVNLNAGVLSPARADLVGNSGGPVIEGMAVKLTAKSDEPTAF